MKDPDYEKELIKRLDELGEKMDTLIQVMAVSSKIETILKDKTKTQQIETLSELGFPKDTIALLVNTTLGTVSARISEMKKRKGQRRRKKG